MKQNKIIRALSVRQPYAEQILCGTKKIEYRSIATRIRERVYIYASQTPGPKDAFEQMNASRRFSNGCLGGDGSDR